MPLVIAGFGVCVLIILYCGIKLSHYGDQIAEKTGTGKAWFGLITMASITSLPELFTGIGSAAVVGSADLAVGNVMGSCVFNLAFLSLLDAFSKKTTLFSAASQSHILAAALGIILFSFVGLGLYLPDIIRITDWIGIFSIVFIIIYLISVKLVYEYDKKNISSTTATFSTEHRTSFSLKKLIVLYIINALFVIWAALLLPGFAEKISHHTGLAQSFVGTLFLAASTTLPEMVVSVSAIKIKAIDMAVGNLLGSNLFNIFILAVDDLFYRKGNILHDASENNIISVFSTIIMTSIAIVGLTYRAGRKNFVLAWDTLLILCMYIINMILLYHLH
jgi:cation:H+ antiporter